MATLEQLYAALEKADAAGETDDARDIADLIRSQRSQDEETSSLSAAAHGALRGALPAAAGIVSGAAGATAGSLAGPFGTVAGGLGAGFAGSAAMSAAQEKFLAEHPDFAKALGLDVQTAAKEQQQHPYASMAGELAPNLLAFRPSGALLRSSAGLEAAQAAQLAAEKTAAASNAIINAGVGAGIEAGQEAMGEEPVDWTKVGIAGLGGALGQKETGIGRGLTRIGELPASAATRTAVGALRRPGEALPPEEIKVPSSVAETAANPDIAPYSESQDLQGMLDTVANPEGISSKPVEPTEVIPEVSEKPKFAVDETGEKLSYPMFVDMADKGYQLYSFENPRTYTTKGGTPYRTLEKDGARVALEPQQVLFTDPKKPYQQPQLGMGNEKDVAFHFLGVDPEVRGQGKAREALQDLVDVADKNGYTLYGEPAQLEKEGITVKDLNDLYSQYGFKPSDESGKVIVREPIEKETQALESAAIPEAAAPKAEELIAKEPGIEFSKEEAKATPEQVEKAQSTVKRLIPSAEVAYQDGDVGLIRGYTDRTGEVIYTPYKDGSIYRHSVNDFKDADFRKIGITAEQQKRLLAAKDRLESEAQAAHEAKPFLKFEKDSEFSPDIPPNLQKVAQAWKDLLGIKQKIYFTTMEHAAENRASFTGPHRKIGSASAMQNENGFTSPLADGNRVVAFKKTASVTKNLETIAHELGHAHMDEVYAKASPEIKSALEQEHLKWARSIKGETFAKDLIESLRARKTGKTTTVDPELRAKNLQGVDTYWRSFKEWYADQTSRWATTTDKPVSIVEKFFSKLGKAIKSFYSKLKNAGYLPNETFKKYLDSQTAKLDLEPIGERTSVIKEEPTLALSKEAAEEVPKAPIAQAENVLSAMGKKQKNILNKSYPEAGIKELPTTTEASFPAPPVTKFSEFTRIFQNKHVDLKRTVNAIKKQFGEINERWNPYLKEGLWKSKAANESRVFLEKEVDPLVKKMEKYKVTNQELHDYLHNRHAEEFNNQMNTLNPDIVKDDGTVIPYKLKDRASGIKTKDAREYLANLESNKKAALEDVAKDIDRIVKGTQEILIKTGQETPDVINAWNKKYEHYVPLFRIMEDNKLATATKRGMGVSGPFSKRAMGSEREVADIANSILGQREKAIEAAAKLEVDRALYGLAIKYPQPDLWLPVSPKAIKNPDLLIRELDAMGLDGRDIVGMMKERQTRKIVIDPKTGLEKVEYVTNPLERYKDNVLPIRINGEDSYIFFNKNNPTAANMARAFHNMDVPTMGLAGQQIGKLTQWMAKVNTQWNPVFGALNFTRDFGSAMANLSNTELAGEQAKVAGGIKSAMGAIWSTMRAERAGTKLPDTAEARLYQEFREHGGQTLYREQIARRADQENIINEKIKQLRSNSAKKAASGFFNVLSDFNDSIENAIRLSAYKAAKEKGLSPERAATIAKELTVNFDRQGAYGKQINNYFAFFNASSQGIARMFQTLGGPAGKKIIMGGLGLGALQAGMMEMAGFGDNDPPEFVKSRNFILPTFDGKYVAIPYPLGLHFLPNIGRLLVETGLRGDPQKHIANMAAVVADSFNPLGGGDLSLQTITPTVLDPAVALATNQDAFGRPISKLDKSTAPTTGLSRSREQSSSINKAVAEAINYITGGTEDTKGFLSPTADQLDYLVGQVTGGVGREAMKVGKTAEAIATGDTENLASYDIPLAGRFYGDTKSPAANSQHFYDNVTKMAEYEATIKGMRERKENVAEFLRDNPDARLWQQANNAENQISAINKRQKNMRKLGIDEDKIKALDDRKQDIMTRFNERVLSMQQ